MIERCSVKQERLRFDEASLERFLSQQAAFQIIVAKEWWKFGGISCTKKNT